LKREHGSAAGRLPNLEKILPEYYEKRGWDENGIPTMERLNKLDLEHLANYRDSRIELTER
jgi:aldehyde:ferredoxin oxidoreductase